MSCILAARVRRRLSAADVDAHLRRAIREMQAAEQSVFLWFCEIERRCLYRELGYASIHAYASQELGFTRNRVGRYLHLMRDLEDLPAIREALHSGRLGWTKARVIVRVASAANEGAWLAAALRLSRRELEATVAEAQAARRHPAGQPVLVAAHMPAKKGKRAAAGGPATAGREAEGKAEGMIEGDPENDAGGQAEPPVFRPPDDTLSDEGKTAVTFRLNATDLARYEALIEKLLKQGRIQPGTPREQILLQALAAFAEAGDAVPRGTGATKTHIHIQKDLSTGRAVVQTQHGPKTLSRAELEAAECDAAILEPGQRSRSAIPPAVRRAVLERDRHRCQAPGCRNTHFLEIHHIQPVSHGGTNALENLTTLCSRCHRLMHAR